MSKLVRQRMLALPFLIVGVTLLVFLSVRLIPGDPARAMAGDFATQAQVDTLRHTYGLDRPLAEQYRRYLMRLVHADLGESLTAKRSVSSELGDRLPASVELALAALALGVPAGLLLGVRAAVRRDTLVDNVATAVSLLGLSVPSFWLALMIAWVFGVELGWLPFSGQLVAFSHPHRLTGLVTVDALLTGDWATLLDGLRHLILPALTLAVIPVALVARYTRAGFIEALSQDYVRTARAFGIPERRIVWVYASKNALLPLVTLLGVLVPALLAGAVLVETVFSWPGVGTFLLQAIGNRDYPVIQGVTLVFALIYVMANLLVDLSYGMLDPRTRTR